MLPRYIMFDGGFVIKVNNQVIGGIGVSGGNIEQDAIVAHVALSIC